MKAVIIGGGASGIAAAIKIKQNNPNFDVTVLEHLDDILKKIHATGNGRCNIANKNAEHYDEVFDFLSSLGLILREDECGRMYPYSLQAATVVDVLKEQCDNLGINIVTDCEINRVEHFGDSFFIYTSKGVFESATLILATGGKAQKALGSDGSGYELAKSLGHTITDLSPALVQLKSSNKNCRSLKGTRTKCLVKIETNGETIGEEYGELLFTDYGLSGIVVMNLSVLINDKRLSSGQDKTVAIIDFVPEMSENKLKQHLEKFGSFAGILPQKLCSILEKQSNGEADRMARCVKNQRIIITGTKGYDFAQITKGGVPTSEITDCNESKIIPYLYITGELTDNQFECGGFNLTYAIYS
ncbi:MAG: aminoacetone oxidase family FAD-binding enzyme, partial [Clostridia bacterium]|nr:aminoacetone oxidase family FAD-binding enzyme [Clostridia bacterium]